MRTGGSFGGLKNARGTGSPNLNRSLGAMTDSAPSSAMANHGRFPAAPGAPKKVANVKLTGGPGSTPSITR
jgi:hypothetical protein